jgi:hypothetical protein
VLALLGLTELVVLDPAPAVRADVVAGLGDRCRGLGIALEGEPAAIDRHRQLAFAEQAHQAPETDAAAILEQAFGGEVAALDGLAHTVSFAQTGIAVILAVLDGRLGAFLVVHDEVDGEPRAVGPLGVGHVGAIAHEIAPRRVRHCDNLRIRGCGW